jgi:hypothetical protein
MNGPALEILENNIPRKLTALIAMCPIHIFGISRVNAGRFQYNTAPDPIAIAVMPCSIKIVYRVFWTSWGKPRLAEGEIFMHIPNGEPVRMQQRHDFGNAHNKGFLVYEVFTRDAQAPFVPVVDEVV